MSVKTNVGQIAAAIESGKRAAASIDYGPIKDLSTIDFINRRVIGDWQNLSVPDNSIVWGTSVCGDSNEKVSK